MPGNGYPPPFADAGMKYERSPLPKSSLYLEALPCFNRAAVVIPDHPILLRELRGLERRTHRSGKDTVDHGQRGADDHANALCGCLYIAMHALRRPKLWVGACGTGGRVQYLAKNNPHMEEELASRLRYVRVDERGKELTPEEAQAIRNRVRP